MNILSLRPTQFVLGMKDVEYKVATILSLKGEGLAKYFRDHPVPLIKGPQGLSYMIDRHHLARACWQTGQNDFQCFFKEDLSHLDVHDFWQEMLSRSWTYLHDHHGILRQPSELPPDITTMIDDPYRSLAWAVAKEGGFKKLPIPFLEFRWAAFYRGDSKIKAVINSDFDAAVVLAKNLSRSDSAKQLPGFLA